MPYTKQPKPTDSFTPEGLPSPVRFIEPIFDQVTFDEALFNAIQVLPAVYTKSEKPTDSFTKQTLP